MITEDIERKLGGIDNVEHLCTILDCDIIYDTDIFRKRLKLEPFEYLEEETTVKRNML